ncbi:MAG: hypothetical protein MUF01_04045 [Bryobacterales bacterium]|nr:hypothetical protein [Bryobacterales bacterium]
MEFASIPARWADLAIGFRCQKDPDSLQGTAGKAACPCDWLDVSVAGLT